MCTVKQCKARLIFNSCSLSDYKFLRQVSYVVQVWVDWLIKLHLIPGSKSHTRIYHIFLKAQVRQSKLRLKQANDRIVEGHVGALVFGYLGKSESPVVLMVGRAHFYEGHSMQDITFPMRVMTLLGINQVIGMLPNALVPFLIEQ